MDSHWYGPDIGYHVGDPQPGARACDKRPGIPYRMDEVQWVWVYDESLEPATAIPKSLLIRRMAAAGHYDAFEAALANQSAGDRALWAAVTQINTRDPVLRPELVALFGTDGAAALLAAPTAEEIAAGWV